MFTNRLMKTAVSILISILIGTNLTSFVYSQTKFKSGVVMEAMDSGGYTYLSVNVDRDTVWLAAPLTIVSSGDTVHFSAGMLMTEFISKSLNRTFDEIYFTGTLLVGSKPSAKNNFSHTDKIEDSKSQRVITKAEIDAVQKIDGGKSIAEIQASKNDFAGKTVRVRGIVTKYNDGIMNRNWLHLRDASTGIDGEDLVVTTQNEFNIGDVVELEGTLVLDKNFGFGYQYTILLEHNP